MDSGAEMTWEQEFLQTLFWSPVWGLSELSLTCIKDDQPGAAKRNHWIILRSMVEIAPNHLTEGYCFRAKF